MNDLSVQDILDNVAEMVPTIRGMANRVSDIGRMPDELTEMLRKAGVFRIAFPKSRGGPEMRLEDQIRLVEMIAEVDASVAWNVMILVDSGFFAGAMPDSVSAEIYDSIDYGTAGALNPPGRARRVEGGFRVTGRWPFGSGITNADRVCGGAHIYENGTPVVDAEGKKQLYVFYLPKAEINFHNNWNTIGLRGSGSQDYSVEDVFVPDCHMLKYEFDGRRGLPPLSKYTDVMMVNQWGVPLGIASGIVKKVEELARAKVTRTGPMKKEYRVQVGVAEARGLFEAARAYAYATARELSDALWQDDLLSDELRARMFTASVMAAQLAMKSVEKSLEVVGVTSIFAEGPYDRPLRDMLTAIRHVIHQPKFYQLGGCLALGELPEAAYG